MKGRFLSSAHSTRFACPEFARSEFVEPVEGGCFVCYRDTLRTTSALSVGVVVATTEPNTRTVSPTTNELSVRVDQLAARICVVLDTLIV